MSDFKQARDWINYGKKVRRKFWANKKFFLPVEKEYPENYEPYLTFEDIDALDWEIFGEPKESLSDKEFSVCTQLEGDDIGGIHDMFLKDDVKEKIQKAHERLKRELHLTIQNANQIDKIFKEEFGEELL